MMSRTLCWLNSGTSLSSNVLLFNKIWPIVTNEYQQPASQNGHAQYLAMDTVASDPYQPELLFADFMSARRDLARLAELQNRHPKTQVRKFANTMAKKDDLNQTARVVILTVNDVYDMYPDEYGRGGNWIANVIAFYCCR